MLPLVPSLCRDQANVLLASLNSMHAVSFASDDDAITLENYVGAIQESVYHTIIISECLGGVQSFR